MTCPGCRDDIEPVPLHFTWWGGALGPRLLSHVACPSCHCRFNGKTGKANTAAIAAYVVCTGAATVAAMYLLVNSL